MKIKSDKPLTDLASEGTSLHGSQPARDGSDADPDMDLDLDTDVMADRRSEPSGAERREHQRFDTAIAVDYASGETFLFAYLQNISEMGIFIRTDHPAAVGTRLRLRFHVEPDEEPLTFAGEVTWINPLRASGDNLNPGMGVRFTELSADKREQVVSLVRTVAYLHADDPDSEAQA